jgi:hypothetical protein
MQQFGERKFGTHARRMRGVVAPSNFQGMRTIMRRTPAPPPSEAAEEAEDDYRHRMKMNVLGLLVTILLVISGVWIADTMAETRKLQDCFLAGGRNCAPIRRTGENIRQSSDLTGSPTSHLEGYRKLPPRIQNGDFSQR